MIILNLELQKQEADLGLFSQNVLSVISVLSDSILIENSVVMSNLMSNFTLKTFWTLKTDLYDVMNLFITSSTYLLRY